MVASRFLHSSSRGNGIGTEGAKALAGALMVNDVVHTVWLQSVSPETPSLLRGRNFSLMTLVSLLQKLFLLASGFSQSDLSSCNGIPGLLLFSRFHIK